MRRVTVKGKYTGKPGILTYTGESITVPVPVIPNSAEEDGITNTSSVRSRNELIEQRKAELASHSARQHEEDVKAAHQASEMFFFKRAYEQLSFTVEEVKDWSPPVGLHTIQDFEELGTTIDLDDEEDEEV